MRARSSDVRSNAGSRCGTLDDLNAWLEESESRQQSALGVFVRFTRSIGLHRLGKGAPSLLSSGCYYDPEQWAPPFAHRPCLLPGGYYDAKTGRIEALSHLDVAEDTHYSWFTDPGGPRHPWESETQPAYATDRGLYTFAKATRYRDQSFNSVRSRTS
jgi:hydrogenase large subunit